MSGPLPGVLGPFARAASSVYELGVRHRNRRFDAGHGVERVPVPVVSVGNLSVGGTGKSPFVRHVVRELRALGARPAIAMRGYARRRGGQSDEELEYAMREPDVPLVVDPDRVTAIRRALAAGREFDVVVLDDGFQHRRLSRDLDIVLVDASRPALDGGLLPAGWLREPAAGLRRADITVLTRSDDAQAERVASSVRSITGRPPDVRARHAWRSVETLDPFDGVVGSEAVASLRDRRVAVLAAIGNPASFRAQIESSGASITESLILRDHARFDDAALAWVDARIGAGDAVMCTMKDWVKLGPALARLGPRDQRRAILVPSLQLEIESGGERLREALASVLVAGRGDVGESSTG